jgi:hypothetical protein
MMGLLDKAVCDSRQRREKQLEWKKMTDDGRPEFRSWVDRQPDPGWGLMPLTHVCKSLIANDIVREGRIEPKECDVFSRSLAYFFYGRPAYRTNGDGPIKNPAACPMCFIFDPKMLDRAHAVHPFDTGAFNARLYKYTVMDEMNIQDFTLGRGVTAPNKLIKAIYGSRDVYFDGDPSKIPTPDKISAAGELLVRTYVALVRSDGRNEADDRVGTIEVTFGDPVPLEGNLIAIVIPDILWNDKDKSDWLKELSRTGVDILPFRYSGGRHPEHYHDMIEVEVRAYFEARGDI